MKTSVIVPLHNDARHVPALLRGLGAATAKTKDCEILFIDHGSSDGTPEMLTAAKLAGARILREPRHGFAEPLNLGLAESSGDFLLFLSADASPDPKWIGAMEKALTDHDLAVGATLSVAPKKRNPCALLAAKLFEGHSERTAHARGHALPWGPSGNLGARRGIVEKTGPFSPDAAGAFDIDWCWRAMLQGARITFAPNAKVKQSRFSERRELLEQFERFGLGEAWLHRTYAFLLDSEDRAPDALLSGVEAFRRLRHGSEAAKSKALAPALEEVAAAFAGGVRLGYERPHRECPIERATPGSAISWRNGAKSVTVLVPGKGLAVLEGKQLQLWEAMRAGQDPAALTKLFMRLFKATEHEAHHELEEFRNSLEP